MIILKIGGGKSINWDFISQDIVSLKERLIIVHGANAWMKEISKDLGLEERMIISPSGQISRYTDEKTMEVLTMVYSGLVNKKMVACLQGHGINAIGLTGADGKLWLGEKKTAILSQEEKKVKVVSDSATGKVKSVNVSLLNLLLDAGYTPVITIPAITESGELINVDTDRAVAVMARDLGIKTMIFLFEAAGLLVNPDDPNSTIATLTDDQLEIYIEKTKGRMKKKLLGIKEAFLDGVETVYFGDGRIPLPISSAIAGKGTVITK